MRVFESLCRVFARNLARTKAERYSFDSSLDEATRGKYRNISRALNDGSEDELPENEKSVANFFLNRMRKRERTDELIKPERDGGLGYG